MPSLLQKLENNEAILLMYLAEELNGEDRLEVEQMLATDAVLRAELSRLREADGVMSASLEAWDEAHRTAVAEPVALRQASRMLKQWQVDRAMRQPAPIPAPRGLRYPWWAYPTAAAAAVFLAIAYWGLRGDVPGGRMGPIGGPGIYGIVENPPEDGDSMSPEQRQLAERLQRSFDTSDDFLEDAASNHLNDVEKQMQGLAESSDDLQLTFPEDL